MRSADRKAADRVDLEGVGFLALLVTPERRVGDHRRVIAAVHQWHQANVDGAPFTPSLNLSTQEPIRGDAPGNRESRERHGAVTPLQAVDELPHSRVPHGAEQGDDAADAPGQQRELGAAGELATRLGVKKMPTPTIAPMTTAVASKLDSWRCKPWSVAPTRSSLTAPCSTSGVNATLRA